MKVTKKGTLVNVDFPDGRSRFEASYIRDRDGIFKTELQVYAQLPVDGSYRMMRVNRSHPDLLDDLQVNRLTDSLEEKTKDYPNFYWGSQVDMAKDAIIDTYREGEPAVVMGNLEGFSPRIYDIRPMFIKGVANLMWAPGGSAKSYWALLSCVMVDKGLALMGLRARKGVALFLDWEETEDVFRERIAAVHRGLDMPLESGVIYKKMSGSLANNIEMVSKMVMDYGVTYMVVDNVGAALGGNGVEQQVVEDYFAAGNLLGITWVSIDHANRAGETTGNWQIHGSAFKYARARQVYEFRKEQEDDSGVIEVMVYHRKTNDSGIKSPRGYTVKFDMEKYYIPEIDDYESRLVKVTFDSLMYGDADDKFLSREPIGKICYERVRSQGEQTLERLSVDVRRIKDVDTITTDTIRTSIENFTVRVEGKKINPMMVGADGQTVQLVTSGEVTEWTA